MNPEINTLPPAVPKFKPWWRRALRPPFMNMIGAGMAMSLSLALSFALMEAILPKEIVSSWGNLVGTLACALGYWEYANLVERRTVNELSGFGAIREWFCGAALGMLLGMLTLAPLWVTGVYRLEGVGDSFRLLIYIPEMVLVSVFEELLIRGVIFRIAEQAWGSRRALMLSTMLFVAAHLPGEINIMGLLVTAAASVALSTGYQLSRRLWLPIGMHFAWNYLFTAVFSLPVSGHEAKGWLLGSMNGPKWLSGGTYGVEASAIALFFWVMASALLLRRLRVKG